jgi:hypothetical protein
MGTNKAGSFANKAGKQARKIECVATSTGNAFVVAINITYNHN